jgi:hypothetical protein
VRVDADSELDEVEHVRLDGDMSVEIVELEVDQVDLELRHVQEDVRWARRILLLSLHVTPVLDVGVVGLATGFERRAPCVQV